jgi:hypothetical protein
MYCGLWHGFAAWNHERLDDRGHWESAHVARQTSPLILLNDAYRASRASISQLGLVECFDGRQWI